MIVIPMAGLSSRFTKAGYDRPKYMLPLQGKTVFWHSVMSFKRYFNDELFLFIAREVQDTFNFLKREIEFLGIKNYKIIILDQETSGQAETVALGIEKANVDADEPLVIFNIDSFRYNYTFPEDKWFEDSDGYLEVFKGSGSNWSYVAPLVNARGPMVERTTEKDPISDLCSNGLYYFGKCSSFMDAFSIEQGAPSGNETYIAPLYNHLIKEGKRIHYKLISYETTTFCGVPAEYESLKNSV